MSSTGLLTNNRASLALVQLIAAAVGLAVGVLSFLAQGRLPGDWYYLGNSGAVWLVPAFFMGALAGRHGPRWAAAAGFGTLAGCLAGYFVTGTLWGVPYAWALIGYWVGVALVGGPLFGLAGGWWRDARQWRRALALALLGGVFLAEGAFALIINPHLSVGWPLVGAGLLAPVILGRTNRDRLLGLAALLPVAAVGGAAFAVLLWLNVAVSGN